MELSRIRALRGPNLWTRNTAIEALVSCTPIECAIDEIAGFEARLRERFPEISLFQPVGNPASAGMAHVLEYATLCLQAQAGCPVTFSRTTQTVDTGIFQVVVEYTEEAVGRLALDLAVQLCESARADTPFDIARALHRLRELNEDVRLGPSTGSIVNAALARDVPMRRLTEGSLVQLGWGSRQRRIQAAETDNTSAVAQAIAQDKDLTKRLLHAAGIPVPEGRPVENASDAWAAASEIGGAVVVKPQDGNQGKGVVVNLTTREQVEAAYLTASSVSDDVMVERYTPGYDFRVLVVGDRMVAAARRDPPQVIGDGVHTVLELVDEVNSDPHRGEGHATSLTRIRFDEIALARLADQGMTENSIPARGQRVILRNNANLSTGGTATDVTDDVHPDLAACAVAAAQTVGLDIAGIDLICDSVLQPLEEQGGGIVEINAVPGLRMHLQPSYGKGRPVGEAIIDTMFPRGENGRIPLVAVAGTNGKTTTVRLIHSILAANGYRTGMTSTDGIYLEGMRLDSGDCSGPQSARRLLLHPDVDAAVLETARGGILREGLGFDRCDVAVVTNIGKGDHLGLANITTVEDLSVVKRVIVQNVTPVTGTAVLNAGDPMVAMMADACPGKIIFFAKDRSHPVMAAHIALGKRAVYVDGESIVAREGDFSCSVHLAEIPITHCGKVAFQVENAMAAIAAAWALGVDWQVIRTGLGPSMQPAPGRFNLFDYNGATLIADYGHNADAMSALVQAIETIPAQKRFVVISGAGDRRDEDLRDQTRILGEAFDEVVLYQDQCQRGRADGEVLKLLREGLAHASRTSAIHEIRGEFLAINTALERVRAGDLCLILVDQVEEALGHIAGRSRGAYMA